MLRVFALHQPTESIACLACALLQPSSCILLPVLPPCCTCADACRAPGKLLLLLLLVHPPSHHNHAPMKKPARWPLGSICWWRLQAYSTPSSCSWLSLPCSTTSNGRESHRG